MEVDGDGRRETAGKPKGVEKSKVSGGLICREAGRIHVGCGVNWIKMWRRSHGT